MEEKLSIVSYKAWKNYLIIGLKFVNKELFAWLVSFFPHPVGFFIYLFFPGGF